MHSRVRIDLSRFGKCITLLNVDAERIRIPGGITNNAGSLQAPCTLRQESDEDAPASSMNEGFRKRRSARKRDAVDYVDADDSLDEDTDEASYAPVIQDHCCKSSPPLKSRGAEVEKTTKP